MSSSPSQRMKIGDFPLRRLGEAGVRHLFGVSGFTASLPTNTIHARGHSVDVGAENYQAVTLKEVLKGVTDAVRQVGSRAQRPVAAAQVPQADGPHADLVTLNRWIGTDVAAGDTPA